jgi:outer membrane protein assembly factor BamB
MITGTDYPTTTEGGSVLFDGTSIWTAQQIGNTVTLQQLDPVTGTELNSYAIAVSGNAVSPGAMTFLAGSIWFVGAAAFVEQIDPASGLLLNEFLVDVTAGDTLISARGITSDGAFLYAAYAAEDAAQATFCAAIQMDPSTGALNWTTKYSTSNGAAGPVFDDATLWVDDRTHGNVVQLSLAGAILHTLPIPGTPNLGPLIVDDGFVTLVSFSDTSLYQVNTATLAITGPFTMPAGRFPLNLVADPLNNIWVVDLDFGTGGVDVDVFHPAGTLVGTLISDLTDTGTGMAYDSSSGRVWLSGATPSNPVMLAMGLAAAGGVFEGTFAGFTAPGHFGGGTK